MSGLDEYDVCLFRWNRYKLWRAFQLADFVLCFVVPVTVSGTLYFIVYRILWQRNTGLKRGMPHVKSKRCRA